MPWFAVYGNHDTTFLGTLGVPATLRALALGDPALDAAPASPATPLDPSYG